jgi:peroxiredoxin
MTAPEVGDPAPDAVLRDAGGEEIRLASFWSDRPAVAVFLRHWG